jgi:uncharacterized protein (DUF1501 family)
MRNIAQVHLAGLGTRILYTTAPQNSFDTHATEMAKHPQLWQDVSSAVSALYQDLKEHNASANVVIFLFTEFGRRVHDNGSGTDHGSGGLAFVIGDAVKGGLYGEYPSLAPAKLLEGDLHYNNDFRSTMRRCWSSGWFTPNYRWCSLTACLPTARELRALSPGRECSHIVPYA